LNPGRRKKQKKKSWRVNDENNDAPESFSGQTNIAEGVSVWLFV